MRIVKFSGSAKYRIDEKFWNLTIFQYLNNLKKKLILEMSQFLNSTII